MQDVPPGTEIGRDYVVDATISIGGMGAVYRGRRTADDVPVALKLVLEQRNAARFQIEARLLARLRHPRVVRVLDHVTDERGQVLVMELVPGPSLADVLRERGTLPAADVVEYAHQACEALAYVHAQRVVHRDVKPANLIVGDDGVVLVDFGIARETERTTDAGTRGIGTPAYMAPEALTGGIVSPRSDVYSLGATVWTLITGEPPTFLRRGALSDHADGVDAALDATVNAALEPDPYLRLPSAEAFARALGEGLGPDAGASLGRSIDRSSVPPDLLETIVRSAAGVLGAATASIALVDPESGELVYASSWGTNAEEIVGVRMEPGTGLAGAVLAEGEPEAIADCRADPRFARDVATRTGYVPHTMLILPLRRGSDALGILQVLDRRDGGAFGPEDVARGSAFADLALATLGARAAGTTAH